MGKKRLTARRCVRCRRDSRVRIGCACAYVLPRFGVVEIAQFFESVELVEHRALFIRFLKIAQNGREQAVAHGVLQLREAQNELVQTLHLRIAQPLEAMRGHRQNRGKRLECTAQVVDIAFAFTPGVPQAQD